MGRRDIAELLLGSGAPLTVHAAAMLGMHGTVEAYLQRDPSLAARPGAHGISMLFHAALSGEPEMVEQVAHAAAPDDFGHALHAAVMARSLPVALWLVNRGPALNVPDFQQRTPLQRADERGLIEIAELLRRAGG
jgi:hypothetical protein